MIIHTIDTIEELDIAFNSFEAIEFLGKKFKVMSRKASSDVSNLEIIGELNCIIYELKDVW